MINSKTLMFQIAQARAKAKEANEEYERVLKAAGLEGLDLQ